MVEESNPKKGSFRRCIQIIKPPDGWRFPVIILTGILIGLLLSIFYISNAASYISNDPKACVNCHIMAPYYATWLHGSHGRVTTCNDCHVPHNNVFNTYLFKAKDGMRHAAMFTLRLEPQVIQIKDAGKHAVQSNCIRCHSNTVHPIALRSQPEESIIGSGDRYCWDCHREVPHGRVNSLTSAPYAPVPRLNPVLPDWLTK